MKRSNDESYFEEMKRKEIKLTGQVIISLDETIGSKLLHHKFKYQTTELQLFLQNVPVLLWYPCDIIGTTIYDTLDACLFSAVMRNYFHDYSNFDMVKSMLDCNFKHKFNIFRKDDKIVNATSEEKFKKLLKGLLNDELFILEALEEFKKGGNYKNPLEYISDQLKEDEKFMLKAMKIIGSQLKNSVEFNRLLKDNENYLVFSEEEDDQLSDEQDDQFSDKQDETLFDDEEFVLQAVKQKGTALEHASDRLKDNELIVLEAVKQDGWALEYTSDRLKDNEEIVLQGVKNKSYALRYASDRLRNDEEFILQLVKQNGKALEYASKRLKDNETIVLEAIKQDGWAFKFASDRLKNNEQEVIEAVKQNGYALQFASDGLKDNEQVVYEAVNHDWSAITYASDRLRNNEEFILEIVKLNAEVLRYVSDLLRDNEQLVLEAVKQKGNTLEFASDRLRDNEIIVLEAVKQINDAFFFASDRLKNDFNFAQQIFKYCNSFNVFEHFGVGLRTIEFINYYIENYQSNFHELIRNNTNKTNSNAISSLEMIYNETLE